MRRLYTVEELQNLGFTRSAIRWGVQVGRWRKIENGIYGEGRDDPTAFDRAVGAVLATGGAASGSFAGWLLGLDAVEFRGADFTVGPSASGRRSGARRRNLQSEHVELVRGVLCTDLLQTLMDLAAQLTDDAWEQALESALRRGTISIAEVESASMGSQAGAIRMRRVLASRPEGAPPTESLLETRMVQLARTVRGLAPPDRQVRVCSRTGDLVARVDLAWPGLGLFVELDGQHHKYQPVYDARRETAIVAATGWLCGRFTWREVVHLPVVTARRLAQLAGQARRRPLPSWPNFRGSSDAGPGGCEP